MFRSSAVGDAEDKHAVEELQGVIFSGIVALVAAVIAVWGSLRSIRLQAEQTKQAEDIKRLQDIDQRKREDARAISKYREPLARAAYDLQSRLFNSIEQRLFEVYVTRGSPEDKAYVIENTTFILSQYLAWTEIVRQEIQFINLDNDEETRTFTHLQSEIHRIIATDEYDVSFRIFAGEQRAIGEALIVSKEGWHRCIGYGAFLRQLGRGADPLVDSLRIKVSNLEKTLEINRGRLTNLQNALIDLLTFLDPDYIRFPKERRTKIQY